MDVDEAENVQLRRWRCGDRLSTVSSPSATPWRFASPMSREHGRANLSEIESGLGPTTTTSHTDWQRRCETDSPTLSH